MSERSRILFLCTGNCFRSQMGEAILRHVDPVRFEALSAGSQPAGFIHPLVLEVLEEMHIPVIDQYSKSWAEFVGQRIDLLITVCNDAAEEVCPVWPDRPPTVHWPLPDPSFHPGSFDDRRAAARRVAERLLLKTRRLAALDWQNHDADALRTELEAISEL
ncbi:MAG TPA: arsenate reductase ArsC [Phycisphaerae bacterium]|nr:arsenate reductase ArsC [Phycisphaerae bacterium]